MILLEAGEKVAGGQGLAAMGLFVFPGLVWVSVAVHEAGHLLGGAVTGSHALGAFVFGTEFRRTRRGWRMRWTHRLRRGSLGLAIVLPASGAHPRRSSVWLLLGGPLANGLLAVVCIGTVALIDPAPAENLLVSAFLLNLVGLVANLLPFSTFGRSTDGLQLLALRKHDPGAMPGAAYARLQALSLEGVQAQALPESLLQTLESFEPPNGLLVASWYRIIAARNVGDWQAMLERGDAFAARLDVIEDPTSRAAWAPLQRQIEAELVFGRAMSMADAAPLDAWLDEHADAWRRDFDWYVPHVLPRLEALAAALHGDRSRAVDALARSRDSAEQAYDRAARAAEATLRERIEALIPE
jgi:hypothetical protein